jgi:hypothetical protein
MKLEWVTAGGVWWFLVVDGCFGRSHYRGSISRENDGYFAHVAGVRANKFETLEEAKAWVVAVVRME